MEHLPKVSILIPTYNQEAFIQETVRSALDQDHPNLEVVVCDDASTDSTPQLLQQLAKASGPRLKVFLNQENLGITGNHTRGLSRCGGEYIAFLDGDDLFCPGKVSRQVRYLEEHPECTLCYHDVDVFDSDTGRTLYLWSRRIGAREGTLRELVRFGNYLPAVSVMVRRRDLPPEGYDPRLKVYSDWLLWLRTLERGRGRIGYIPEVLARYRRHAENMTNSFYWKLVDQRLVLDLVGQEWPQFRAEARLRRSELEFMAGLNSLAGRRLRAGLGELSLSLRLGFPAFPWLRLLAREALFFVQNGFRQDYIARSVAVSRKQ